MSRPEDVERAVAETVDTFGKIDILVTCAGARPGAPGGPDGRRVVQQPELKFMGYVRACRAVLPRMREQGSGSVVLVVGNDGLKPTPWETTAGVANAADINFASAMAEQYGKAGVRINTVNPGPVNTDRWEGLEEAFARDKGVSRERAHDLAVGSIPFGRICEPEEVADLVAFLVSPRQASFTARTCR
jgi:3-oxoacyl-[acyl-carrier protein] reductase